MAANKNLFLIGFMGSGKSTVARMLSRDTGAELIEMDENIEAEAGMLIKEIFEQYGEAHFRDLETQLLARIGEKNGAIVSCGGGTILRPENVELMKQSGVIVCLQASPETIYERVKKSNSRPLLNGNMNLDYIKELMLKRVPLYEAAADRVVSVDHKKVFEVVDELLPIYVKL